MLRNTSVSPKPNFKEWGVDTEAVALGYCRRAADRPHILSRSERVLGFDDHGCFAVLCDVKRNGGLIQCGLTPAKSSEFDTQELPASLRDFERIELDDRRRIYILGLRSDNEL